jgi:alanine racemase
VIRGPVAEIDLPAIARNLRSVREIAGGTPVIGVVKADAYGHGAIEVSRRLVKEGISYLAVAYTGEAIELRNAGIDIPVIVLFDSGNVRDFFDFNLIPVVYSRDTASSLSDEARKRGAVVKVHVKVDTGMGRLGLCGDHVMDDLTAIADMPGLELTGLLSHFSEADLSDRSYAISQLERFNSIREKVSIKTGRRLFSHVANSAAVLTFKESYLDAVRPGLMLYGYSPFSNPAIPPLEKGGKGGFEMGAYAGKHGAKSKEQKKGMSGNIALTPAMTVKSRILSIRSVAADTPISYGRTFVTNRPSRIGVIPVGYADGYSRLFSNNAEVVVRGKRVPVAGRVCMDLTMVDLTDVRDAEENDEVVLLGRQGDEVITADELAERAKTISYEILTSLGSKSGKVYLEKDKD